MVAEIEALSTRSMPLASSVMDCRRKAAVAGQREGGQGTAQANSGYRGCVRIGGQASSIIDTAERDRWIDIMAAGCRPIGHGQVAAYRPPLSCTGSVRSCRPMSAGSAPWKYIVSIPRADERNVELRELAAPNTIFEGVLSEEGTSP